MTPECTSPTYFGVFCLISHTSYQIAKAELRVKEETISVEVNTVCTSEISNIEVNTAILTFFVSSQFRPVDCFSFRISIGFIRRPRPLVPVGLLRLI
jgi:hypothetical protein